ncbi:MAG TPA: NADH-quinone oxidoreductase subunit J [Aliidongia sp.]|uniref:NADH-quinone oxidoreductase subunit J n=1 Tax=Aliidongia sp. TaxID=1914230 RepID=UPI002DDCB1DB|nr:NADH-quinone oxidoreductase subunit J [Aliidongia sp.]HEV2678471.1 NADH-quinone oxidoreductase subunit J [Aliidongia sp.]
MILSALAFYLFAIILVFSGLMVVTARNPVHSVLFLILAFFNAAGLFVLLGAEFLAMILVVVYVGAVAVLFLFVVMMLDINFAALRHGIKQHLALGLAVGIVLLAELIFSGTALAPQVTAHIAQAGAAPAGATNTQALGAILYTRYIYAFEGSGLILLVAMIGAIVLTHRSRVGVRRQVISAQINRSRAETIEVVKVPTGHGI